MFWSFGSEACRILAPQPGFKPAPPALEGEVLSTGPSGKSQYSSVLRETDTGQERDEHFDRQSYKLKRGNQFRGGTQFENRMYSQSL